MKLLIYFCFVFLLLGVLGIGHDTFVKRVFAQVSGGSVSIFATSSWCTAIGNATGPNPCPASASANGNFTAAAGSLTYFCQGDPKWDDKSACGTGQVGCGPTSVAMILSFFGESVTPGQTFSDYKNSALLSCADGSYPEKVNVWLKQRGYTIGPNLASGTSFDKNEAKKYIDQGYLILGSSQNFKGQRGKRFSHIFVVQDVDPASGTILIRDPENCNYSTGVEFDANKIQPIIGDKIPSWYYAYPIKKS